MTNNKGTTMKLKNQAQVSKSFKMQINPFNTIC